MEGFGELFAFLTKCGCCCFPSALVPSPQLLFLTSYCQRGDSLPRSGEMSKLGKVWFPGPGPASSLLWLTICGLLLSIRTQISTRPRSGSSPLLLFTWTYAVLSQGLDLGGPGWVGQTGLGNWEPVKVWTSSCLQSRLTYLPDAVQGIDLRLSYMKAGTYMVGNHWRRTNARQAGTGL